MSKNKRVTQQAIQRKNIKQDNTTSTVPVQTQTKEENLEIFKKKCEEIKHNKNEKIKRNLTLSIGNDTNLEKLSDKTSLPKSKIVDILLSKFLKLEINDEFDVYNVNITK